MGTLVTGNTNVETLTSVETLRVRKTQIVKIQKDRIVAIDDVFRWIFSEQDSVYRFTFFMYFLDHHEAHEIFK